MSKNKDKSKNKKLHKYDHIDNNYLIFDKSIYTSMMLCGLATGISCFFFGLLRIGVFYYVYAVLERTRDFINQAVFIIASCGVGITGSLAASIVAKIKCRKSRWAVTNIVYISINLVLSVLVSWFFIWLMNTYAMD